ncbi:MAG: glycosyltransferase [Candidatus Tantalella remota]|nr:glycosyltransferase [Candidatus Tantalella remota]
MIKKALIFYISRLSGHYQAASAVEKGLLSIDPDIEIEKVNALGYTNPILGEIINKAYLEVIKHKPELWGNIYDNPDVMKKTAKARDALHKFNMSKVRKLIDSKTPDVIVCTQAFPCGLVADYKRSCGKDTMLVGILTDHAPHSYWLYDEVDYYITPSKETAGVLEKKGVPPQKIKAFGIPVDPKYSEGHSVSNTKEDLGFDGDRPVLLVMGGSQGLGVMEETVRSFFCDERHGYQILVVAGSNKKLYSRLKKMESKNGSRHMRVLSHVDNIDELMEAADLIITKAGGMTTAEALVKKLPMLIIKPIPGHEQMNTDYLVSEGAAIEVTDHREIHEIVNSLFDDGDKIETMRRKCEEIARPGSAVDIAKLILEKIT